MDIFSSDPIMAITEYVPYGDLLGYLRKSRGLNDTYYKDPDLKPQTSLRSKQLFGFALGIANGMEFLSSKKVHLHYMPLEIDLSGMLTFLDSDIVIESFRYTHELTTISIVITLRS